MGLGGQRDPQMAESPRCQGLLNCWGYRSPQVQSTPVRDGVSQRTPALGAGVPQRLSDPLLPPQAARRRSSPVLEGGAGPAGRGLLLCKLELTCPEHSAGSQFYSSRHPMTEVGPWTGCSGPHTPVGLGPLQGLLLEVEEAPCPALLGWGSWR